MTSFSRLVVTITASRFHFEILTTSVRRLQRRFDRFSWIHGQADGWVRLQTWCYRVTVYVL